MKYRKVKKTYKYVLAEDERISLEIYEQAHNDYISLDAGRLIVRYEYAWDGCSGPTIDDKTNMRGSLFHDALYQLMREGLVDRNHRKYIDILFWEICRNDGMGRIRAWYYYRAVRIFSKKFSFPVDNSEIFET